MSTRKALISALACVLLSSLCGCAMFRAGQLEPITSWPPKPRAEKKAISVLFSGRAILNGRAQDVPGRMLSLWNGATLRAYRESGLFSEVKSGLADAEVRAEVTMVERGRVSLPLAFLTGLTLYVVPSNAKSELTVNTTLKDRQGKLLGTYKKSETVTMWQQVFLVFVMPFKFPGTVVRATIYDLNRATIAHACRDGAL